MSKKAIRVIAIILALLMGGGVIAVAIQAIF